MNLSNPETATNETGSMSTASNGLQNALAQEQNVPVAASIMGGRHKCSKFASPPNFFP
jgi:hypothetical protein